MTRANETARAAAMLLLAGALASPAAGETLLEARAGFVTTLTEQVRDEEPMGEPPEGLFSLIEYPGPLGPMAAYLGVAPEGAEKTPAIIWITGGFPPGGIGSSAWEYRSPDNDQSAKAYRKAGLVMMYPALRGSFGNPGAQESFMGEVDDVLAALAHLKTVDSVDPKRIYLGGHSTGGTLALLVAEATDEFKAVIAFGPVEDPGTYAEDSLTFAVSNSRERRLRAPIRYLDAITSPTYVIEGAVRGNASSLRALEAACKNPRLHFFEVDGLTHFDVLAPGNDLLAERLAELGADEALELTTADILARHARVQDREREVWDIDELSYSRRDEVSFSEPVPVRHYWSSYEKEGLHSASAAASVRGFRVSPAVERKDGEGTPYYSVKAEKTYVLGDLPTVFAASEVMSDLADKYGLDYDGWSAR